MELTPELIGTAAVGVLVILGAIGNYLRTLKSPSSNPVVTGIGLSFGEREQMERLIASVNRVADAIGDKNAAGINDRLEELSERIEHLSPRRR